MRYRILYVEDEKILGNLVCETLQKQGYDIEQVTHGNEALHAFKQMKPHLCLLDVMLPGKDGFTIAEQIRAMDNTMPILFLTAKVQASDVVAGFRAGCNDYIRKPFSIDELVVRIESWLNEKYGNTSFITENEYHIGAYVFQPQKQLLQTPTGVIALTYKETELLKLLYIHRNNIVQRDYLMQQIWNNNSVYNSRTLDVYINRLRKYFGDSAYQIITLKGIGYRFICE
jgi:DNA-binding response OmpR family regulator